MVTGIVNPHGASTTWVFQYGPTIAYGMQTFGGTLQAGNAPVAVSEPIVAIQPGTTFHYRLVALHLGVAQASSYGADATFVTLPFPRPVPAVIATTTPHRVHKKPFLFTTFASVIGPASIPKSLSCFGNATIKYFLGGRQVAFTLAPMQPNCTFSAEMVFPHKFGHQSRRLRVKIHFRGNGYLAPSDARTEMVFIG
jgi:hypothetical protein